MPGTPFSWTNTGNYPAGPNAWNGQPLSVAPAQRYFTPNVKPPAENLNEVLGEIAADSTYLHGAVGKYNLFNTYGVAVSPASNLGTNWSTTNITTANPTFTTLTSTTQSAITAADLLSTDLLDIDWQVSAVIINATAQQTVYLGIAGSLGGATLAKIGMFQQATSWLSSGVQPFQQFTFRATVPVGSYAGTPPAALNLALFAAKANGGDATSQVALYGPSVLFIKRYAAN